MAGVDEAAQAVRGPLETCPRVLGEPRHPGHRGLCRRRPARPGPVAPRHERGGDQRLFPQGGWQAALDEARASVARGAGDRQTASTPPGTRCPSWRRCLTAPMKCQPGPLARRERPSAVRGRCGMAAVPSLPGYLFVGQIHPPTWAFSLDPPIRRWLGGPDELEWRSAGEVGVIVRGARWCVGGHEILHVGGHESARWWPPELRGGGQVICPR